MYDDDKIAVQCRGVAKNFHAGGTVIRALRGIDLEVRTGEFLMLVGPSGCGKTTLISVITGILNQDSGECRLFDQEWTALPEAAKTLYRGRHIGFVFQAFNLIPALSAAENVAVPLLINGFSWKESLRRAGKMLDRVGLGNRLEDRPNQLSGGQQQRVAIARALVHEPKLVVCDEPTSALDADIGRDVMELLKSLARADGRALIVVTHDSRIFHYADRIAHMNDGCIAEIVESNLKTIEPRPMIELKPLELNPGESKS